jgi:hypothetical protein
MDRCTFCHADANTSKFYVSTDAEDDRHYHICSACYLVAMRHGFTVVYREVAVA